MISSFLKLIDSLQDLRKHHQTGAQADFSCFGGVFLLFLCDYNTTTSAVYGSQVPKSSHILFFFSTESSACAAVLWLVHCEPPCWPIVLSCRKYAQLNTRHLAPLPRFKTGWTGQLLKSLSKMISWWLLWHLLANVWNSWRHLNFLKCLSNL